MSKHIKMFVLTKKVRSLDWVLILMWPVLTWTVLNQEKIMIMKS